jgi:PRTRC genetic system protein F
MQLNLNEIRLLQGAVPTQSVSAPFRLPTLHNKVPLKATLFEGNTSYSSFGRALVEAGVINPETLPETVATPKDVVEQGLGQWFRQRIDQLQHMQFDVHVLDAESANAHICEDAWHDPKKFDAFVFSVKGRHCDRRYAKPIAVSIEKKAPGLFLAAFEDLIHASWRTLSIHSPQQVLEQTACFRFWDCDWSEIPTDKEALPDLIDRYGSEEEAKHYLPSVVQKAYGEGYCFSPFGQKRRKKPLSTRKRRKLMRSPDKKIARLATQYDAFLQARQRVEMLDARLPDTSAIGLHDIWATCQILFDNDELCLEFVDEHGQMIWESNESTDFLAIEQMPTAAADLKSYFQKLDAVFQMIIQMDALIPLISVSEENL